MLAWPASEGTTGVTFDDLMKIFKTAARKNIAYFEYDHEKGVRAVVEALRDEFDFDSNIYEQFTEILGGAGDAAGGSAKRADEHETTTPPADDPCFVCKGKGYTVATPICWKCNGTGLIPAADPSEVCEWTDGGDVWNTPCMPPDELLTTETFKFCPSCGKPIVFKETKP